MITLEDIESLGEWSKPKERFFKDKLREVRRIDHPGRDAFKKYWERKEEFKDEGIFIDKNPWTKQWGFNWWIPWEIKQK
jgi:hypothetical protein